MAARYNPDIHHRRSIRLRNYDYCSAGTYFVTVCTFQRESLLGEVMDGEMRLNELGNLVLTSWSNLPNHYPHVVLDAFVVMPNHFHGVITIMPGKCEAADEGENYMRTGPKPEKSESSRGLSEIMRAMKTFSARSINELRNNRGCPVWQRNYYEHVIRNEEELSGIRRYIAENPLKWALDENNPANIAVPLL